jgi:hypothetical protein
VGDQEQIGVVSVFQVAGREERNSSTSPGSLPSGLETGDVEAQQPLPLLGGHGPVVLDGVGDAHEEVGQTDGLFQVAGKHADVQREGAGDQVEPDAAEVGGDVGITPEDALPDHGAVWRHGGQR